MFNGLHTSTRRVAVAQAGLAPFVALANGGFAGVEAGLAALYGAAVALAISTVLVLRERQALRHPEWDQHRLMKLFIRVGIERLLVLVGLVALGLGKLGLQPLPLLLGLLLAQLGWLAAMTGRRAR